MTMRKTVTLVEEIDHEYGAPAEPPLRRVAIAAVFVLWIGYATGPRVNARCKGPDQKEVDALVASFSGG